MSRGTSTSAVGGCRGGRGGWGGGTSGGPRWGDRGGRAGRGGNTRLGGGEPVVAGDVAGAGAPADLRGQASGLEGVPDYVHGAVEVKDNVAGFDSVNADLGGWDAGQRGRGHAHAGGQRLRRCQLPE